MIKKLLVSTLMMSVCAGAVHAAEKAVPVSAQQSLTMTIYNEGRALVNDVRRVDLTAGRNQVSFLDISNQVMPASVLVKSSGVKVLEQNFNFDLLSLDSLMQKSVGQMVNVEFINPATGQVTTDKAELLAYEYNRPILKIGNRIETAYPGRVIFNQVPANLSAKPALVFDLDVAKAAAQNMEISYLTTGVSWSADYVIELAKDNKMDLNGLVTLTNNTSVPYSNVKLQLVAGDVNIVQPMMMRSKMAMGAVAMDAGYAENAMAVQPISGYYLYTLKRPTDILSNQTKQVSLLSGSGIKGEKTYQYESPLGYFGEAEFKNEKPAMYLTFANTTNNGLGEALPKGTVRVYEKDNQGGLIFVGEDMINHTAKGQDVRLKLGKDFDITAMGKTISFQKIDAKTSQASFEVKISNAKTTPVTVRFVQNLPKGWKVLSESLKSQKQNANALYWDVPVPAEGDVILTYKILVDNR